MSYLKFVGQSLPKCKIAKVGCDNIHFQFESSLNFGDIISYHIKYVQKENSQIEGMAKSTWSYATVTGLTPNKEYSFRYRVKNKFGHFTGWSQEFTQKIFDSKHILIWCNIYSQST